MTSIFYQSKQDHATRMASISQTSLFLHNLLPRTLAFDCQESYERHLHDAMGWKASTVQDWEV